MSKIKKSWITIISLIAALFLGLGLAFSLPKRVSAFANTYAPSSVFSAGTGGLVDASEKGGEDSANFVQFTFTDGGKVHFRRDLALKWYAEDKESKAVKENYFSMKFAFSGINFKKFTIDFESAEENISKDGKTTNSIEFEAADDEKLNVFINREEKKEEAQADNITISANEDVTIAFDEGTESDKCESGEFRVLVNGQFAGKFTNIGGYFMEYRSSNSSTPNTPITFTAKFPEGTTDSSLRQKVLMKSLNGQNFELKNDRVEDNAPAVLVLNEKLYAFKLGQKFSLSYEAIDVCDDNVTVTREYYMLKSSEDGKDVMPNETAIKTPSDADEETKKQYAEAEKYNYKTLTTSTYFLPSQENVLQTEYVAIRFKLDDDTDDNDTYVYLSWYAAKDAAMPKIGMGYAETTENDGDKKKLESKDNVSCDFIIVNREKEGPRYNILTATETEGENGEKSGENAKAENWSDAVNAYQVALDEAAGKTSAGTGAYVYLPSLRDFIVSNDAGYRNLKFSIYYYKPSQSADSSASSQTSLNYNALRLEVTEKGVYKFRVLAQDASGNAMEYYDKDGNLVSVTGSNIWDIEGIPDFTFEIDYKGPTIEDSEEQSLGYRNDTYNFDSFDIVALSGYKTEYTLYRYNSANIPESVTAPSSYADFVENADEYFKAFEEYDSEQADQSKKILYEISAFQSDVTEDDEAKWNRTDNDYYWDPDSSLSFVPQEAGFYILKLRVEDGVLPGATAQAFQVIEVRNPIDTIPGQSQWLEENVLSVVLFAISGVLAIVVVVLFLVKPSEKKVEEVDLEKLKGKKKNKTEKK